MPRHPKIKSNLEEVPQVTLENPPAAPNDCFDKFIMDHSALLEAEEELLNHVMSKSDTPIISLIGPTRIGKTTLLNIIEKVILKEYKSEMDIHSGFLPIIRQKATAPETGSFDFKDHFIRALISAGEPLISKTTIYDESRITDKKEGDDYPIKPITFESNTTRAYRYRFESCLIHRNTKL
jgi:hypothetical protein